MRVRFLDDCRKSIRPLLTTRILVVATTWGRAGPAAHLPSPLPALASTPSFYSNVAHAVCRMPDARQPISSFSLYTSPAVLADRSSRLQIFLQKNFSPWKFPQVPPPPSAFLSFQLYIRKRSFLWKIVWNWKYTFFTKLSTPFVINVMFFVPIVGTEIRERRR